MRLGLDETGVTEMMAIVDHVRGLNWVADGLFLEDDGGTEEPLIPLPEEDELDDRAERILNSAAEAEEKRLGRAGVPKIWKALSRNFHYLEATWAKHRLLLDRPGIDPLGKLAVGLGVSVTNGSRYFIRYFTRALTHAGWDEGRILEIFGVVDHYSSFNTITSGMQVESDIRPESGAER
jgi:alkylhydroperoxidase/carboxymuconolactone decarboxylase family protein YurZ